MFSIVFPRGHSLKYPQVLRDGFRTLDEAKAARVVSGDIVVHTVSKRVVVDHTWLWEWERADTNSFAQQMIRKQHQDLRDQRASWDALAGIPFPH